MKLFQEFAAFAASTVLLISIATVIGPTPPGTEKSKYSNQYFYPFYQSLLILILN